MTSNKNNNKSMFLYTALIFFVAIILIIISFFGQTNVANKQPSATETQSADKDFETIGEGITQKASVLSKDNAELINENKTLKDALETSEELASSLQSENEVLKINMSNYNLLINAYKYAYEKKTDDAAEVLSMINYDGLTEDQKNIYNNLKKILS